MSSRLNLEALEAKELHYVTRQSNATLMSIIKELPEERQLELGDRTRLIEVQYQGCRYIIAGGSWRQQRDRERRDATVAAEASIDGWYLLRTNLTAEDCPGSEVLSHYKSLLGVEDAFRELKSYLEVRPVYHYRPDRVVNHVRICFIAYWISARLAREWSQLGYSAEVARYLESSNPFAISSENP